MALSDTRAFLEELVLRYDPSADVTEGARAQTELIEPILERVGIDPFDEDIEVFVRERVRTAFPDLAITEADDLTDVLIDPIRVLFEPLVREVKLVKLRSSLRNISSLSDDEVDALMGNFFSSRISGGFAVGVVRAYFSTPQTISVTQTQPATTRSGLRFFATRPQQITADQMLLNIDGSEYYFDINYTAENRGSEYNVEANEIVSIANLPSSTRVRNIRRFRGGTARESSADFSARTQRSLSDKTLTVERGVTSTLYENFPALRQLLVVGFRDAEMTRDIIKGGSLGPVPADDTLGAYYGFGSVSDDLDADGTSPILLAPTGNFVARVGAAGTTPPNWYVTLTYLDPSSGALVVVDAQILNVLAADRVRTDHEMPLLTSSVIWALREKKLTITDIPGGITLPDTAASTLEIRSDEVHIGGKTDVYVAGETEQGTAVITSLTDASPISRGFSAETQGSVAGQEDVVLLNDITNIGDVTAGMSLVLEEGTDAGAYLIIEVLTAPNRVRLDASMTGTQSDLSFRVIDDIDVELTDPKALRVDGADLITSAGSDTVQTASATNFIDVNVQVGDILEVTDPLGGGEFTVQEVGATSLVVTPVLPRTIAAAPYQVYARSEAVNTPVVRVRSLELLDSSGAPTGTTIPYRDPVLTLSQGFQNEGSGFPFDNFVAAGLVRKEPPGGYAVAPGDTLEFTLYDPDRRWDTLSGVVVTHTVVGAGPLSAAALAAEINANPTLTSQGLRATVLSALGSAWLGFVCERLVIASGGTGYTAVFGTLLPADPPRSNADVIPLFSDDTFVGSKIGPRDVIEFITGNNAGSVARVLTTPSPSNDGRITVGRGPLGPEGTSSLYNNLPLRPDVGGRARVGRASVGSVRVFFPSPTSAEFDYLTTRFSAVADSSILVYGPDPENTRTLLPAYPRTDLIGTGLANGPASTLQDTTQNFLLDRIQPGDVLQLLYQPILGSVLLPPVVTVVGQTLVLRLDTDPYITITFPFDMPRQEVADYINTRVGAEIASISGTGRLTLQGSRKIQIDDSVSTSLPTFGITTFTSDHPDKGEYIITVVSPDTLTVSLLTPMSSVTKDSYYRIFRYVQRVSSTEMNSNLDASGLYYADVETVSAAPGDIYNLTAGVSLGTVNHRADGYRLTTDNEATSFSRAEVLRARISPSILLVGSSDSPREYVQLAQQNVQVEYDRSQLTDDIQSFCDSDFQRVVCEEILARHLTPHYVSLNWAYVSGASEPEMVRAVSELLDALEPDVEFEVGDVVDTLRKRGATSVYTPDTSVSSGRVAPFFVLVYHDVDRQVRAQIVRDYVDTVRTQRFIADTITLRRVSPGGIR